MTKRTKVREHDQFIVRLPDGMRGRISQAAEANGRSMNAEFVARLQDSFDPTSALGKSEEIRELQGKYIEATERQNEALRKAGIISERLVMEFARAVMLAAEGKPDDLQRLVEREKEQPTLKKLLTVWSIVGDDG